MPTEPLMQKVEWRRERIQKFIGKGHDVGSSTHAEALDMAKNSELLFAHRMNDLFAGRTKLFSEPYEAGLVQYHGEIQFDFFLTKPK